MSVVSLDLRKSKIPPLPPKTILNLKKTQDKVQFQDFNLEITNKKIVNKLCNCQTRLYFNSN